MILTSQYVIPVTSMFIENGGVVVQGDRIVEVGPVAYLTEKYPEDELIDYGQAALLPGFVDVHTHLGYSALRGMVDDRPYAEWKREVLLREMFMSREDWDDSARLGALECLASGITTIADITGTGCSLVAAREAGLRARIYCEVMTMHKESVDQVVEDGARVLGEWQAENAGNNLLSFGMAVGPLYMCHPKVIEGVAKYATKAGLPIAMHLAGSEEECDFIRYGSSPFSVHASTIGKRIDFTKFPWMPAGTSAVQYVYHWGGFDAPDVLAVHCVHVDDIDIQTLKKCNVAVGYCPRINSKLGMGMAPVNEFIEQGLRVGMGTDSVAAVDTMDMIDEMRTGLMLSRAMGGKHNHMNAIEMLRMATIDAAAALGMEHEIGSLEAGKKADIIAIDLHNSHQNPTTNPPSAVIYTAHQDNVKMTMIDGKILFDNFTHVSGLKRDEIVRKAKELRERIRRDTANDELRAELLATATLDRRDRYSR